MKMRMGEIVAVTLMGAHRLCGGVSKCLGVCVQIAAATTLSHYENKPAFHYQHKMPLRQCFLYQKKQKNTSPLLCSIHDPLYKFLFTYSACFATYLQNRQCREKPLDEC